jgi:hypothetical protein
MMVVGIAAGALISIPAGKYVADQTAPPPFRISVSGDRYGGHDLLVSVRNSGSEAAVVHLVSFQVTQLTPAGDAGGCLAHTDPPFYQPATVSLQATSLTPGQVVPGTLIADGTSSSNTGDLYTAPKYAEMRVGAGGIATLVVNFADPPMPSGPAIAVGVVDIDVDGGKFESAPVTLSVPDYCGNSGRMPEAAANEPEPLPVSFRRI